MENKGKRRLFPNVAWLSACGVLVFGGMLTAAVYVGILEGAFGCGGGTVGTMVPVAAAVIGYLAGIMNKFADADSG